jgi:hypothetical protein
MNRNGEGESLNSVAVADATVIRPGGIVEQILTCGRYEAWCVRDGVELWREAFDNVVTTIGKNHMLDNYLAGSAFTQVGPFLGLISSVGYGAGPVAADTMASHAGWAEAGNGTNYPLWSTPASNARGACAWSAASAGAKALSAALAFIIATTGGTVKGAFIVLGASAVATNNSTAGTLFSAGTFTGGDKVVSIGDTLNVSWNLSL